MLSDYTPVSVTLNHMVQVQQHCCSHYRQITLTLTLHTHTHTFNSPLSVTTQVSRYQNGKTSLDFTGARDSELQWYQLGHMQICTSLQTDNHTSTPPLSFLQAGCPSCRPTNSVKALKANATFYPFYKQVSAVVDKPKQCIASRPACCIQRLKNDDQCNKLATVFSCMKLTTLATVDMLW